MQTKRLKRNVGKENQTLKELEKTNALLSKLLGRMKKTEERVRGLEDKIVSSASSSSSSTSTPRRPPSRRKNVPPEVRVRNHVHVTHVLTCVLCCLIDGCCCCGVSYFVVLDSLQ